LTADGTSERPQHEVPYLHVRAPRRVVGVGGEAEPVAKITGNRAGLLALAEQIQSALEAEEGMAVRAPYRETDERRLDLFVQGADRRSRMGEPREPERPDYSRML
jgi:hypothetical protein